MAKKVKDDPVVESMSRALTELFTAAMCHCIMNSGPEAAIAFLTTLQDALSGTLADVQEMKRMRDNI